MAFANAHALPTLLVDSGTGKLTGADGVDVGGTLYDVRFVDGTCIALFSGCDSVADFPFATSAAAALAVNALLGQVFVDGPAGQFDSTPGQIAGCSFSLVCGVIIPTATLGGALVSTILVINASLESDDVFVVSFQGRSEDSSSVPALVFASWTPSAVPVPLPGTFSCLGIGLLALVLANRRRAQARCRTQ